MKISTTVAPETHAYLERVVSRGEAGTLSEVLDALVRDILERERRADLERRMAAYYERLTDDEMSAEQSWGAFAEGEMMAPDRA